VNWKQSELQTAPLAPLKLIKPNLMRKLNPFLLNKNLTKVVFLHWQQKRKQMQKVLRIKKERFQLFKVSNQLMWAMKRNLKLLILMLKVKSQLCRPKRKKILNQLMIIKALLKLKELSKETLRHNRKHWLLRLTKTRKLLLPMRTISKISSPNRLQSSNMTKLRNRRTMMLSKRKSHLWVELHFQIPKKLELISN
jgi:hypothetical protein